MSKSAAAKVSAYLSSYASEKGIYMKINYVNPEHVHVLIDLPTKRCLEEVMQLFKGSSSHWINERNLLPGKFGWGRGYGAFSVSHSGVSEVAKYIANQEEHQKDQQDCAYGHCYSPLTGCEFLESNGGYAGLDRGAVRTRRYPM